jgi:hypothetical protein
MKFRNRKIILIYNKKNTYKESSQPSILLINVFTDVREDEMNNKLCLFCLRTPQINFI